MWAIGGTYRFCGQLHKARTHFSRALQFAQTAGDVLGAGYALCGLGGASRLMGRFNDTQQYYAEANEVFEVEDLLYEKVLKNHKKYMRPVHAFVTFKTQEAYERCRNNFEKDPSFWDFLKKHEHSDEKCLTKQF